MVLGGSVTAQAADLGGDCCADLEERVAELEATTARKGNRKVSLKISGWVNEQFLFWDDGSESNVYIGNNDQERSRFKFAGEAKINSEWSAGYTIEIGIRTTRSSTYRQDTDEGTGSTGLDVRKSSWFVKSKKLGKVTVGQDGSATYHLLDDSDFTNTRYYADAESLPTIGITGFFLNSTGQSALTWGNIMSVGANRTPANGERPNIVRYDSPAFEGFSISAAWGEDDMWDAALIYEGEIGDFKIAARIGYAEYTDEVGGTGGQQCYGPTGAFSGGIKCREAGGSATVMHKPTGLFVYGAYGQQQDDRDTALVLNAPVDDEDKVYYIQAGIEKKWIDLGKTTVFGTYRHDDVGTQNGATISNTGLPLVGNNYINGSEIDTWGGGVVQNIEAAAMDLYLIYQNVDGEFDAVCKGGACVAGTVTTVDIDTFHLLQAGARIQF